MLNQILQLIGSIASIIGVPLAVFIFLRQKESQYRKLRQEITKTLSYKIGEGSEITLFEVNSVIESKGRDFKLKPNRIPPDGIIEDLVSDTISNPMLDSDKKHRVVNNMESIHNAAKLFNLLRNSAGPISQFLEQFNNYQESKDKDYYQLRIKEFENIVINRTGTDFWEDNLNMISSTFKSIIVILTTLALVGITSIEQLRDWFYRENYSVSVLFGGLIALIAGILSILYIYIKSQDLKKTFKTKNKKHITNDNKDKSRKDN